MIGSLADWSTAAIALLAFIIAALAARATLKTNNAQQAQLAMQIEQQKYLQASQVTFWLDEQPANVPTVDTFNLLNASSLPIYSAHLIYIGEEAPRCVWFRTVVPPMRDGQAEKVRCDEMPLLLDGAILGFFDSGGQYWTRETLGKLEPCRPPAESSGGFDEAISSFINDRALSAVVLDPSD